MSCCHYYAAPSSEGDRVFSVDANRVSFGHGALLELGTEARALGLRRVAVFTDRRVRELWAGQRALLSLKEAGVDFEVFDSVEIEPTDGSMQDGANFVRQG